MRSVIRLFAAAVAVIALAAPARAAQAAAGGHQKGKPMATAGTATVATGKIVKFDASANTVTIATSGGEQQFVLNSSSKIREGSKSLAAADLEKLAGHRATIRYTESNGQKMVQSLGVAGGPKGRRAKKG